MTSWSCTAGTSRSPMRDLVRGLAPLACKTDKIDAWVLAELSRRELVPAIWLPAFEHRAERERARPRRPNRSDTGQVCPNASSWAWTRCLSDERRRTRYSRQRELLARLDFPEPWRGNVLAAVAMIDDLDTEIAGIDRELRQLG